MRPISICLILISSTFARQLLIDDDHHLSKRSFSTLRGYPVNVKSKRRISNENSQPQVLKDLHDLSGCPGEVCGTLAGDAVTPLLAGSDECAQQDMADRIINESKQFETSNPTVAKAMKSLAIIYRQSERNTQLDFAKQPALDQNSVFCQKAPENRELDGLVQKQSPFADPNLFFDPKVTTNGGTVIKGSAPNTFPFDTNEKGNQGVVSVDSNGNQNSSANGVQDGSGVTNDDDSDEDEDDDEDDDCDDEGSDEDDEDDGSDDSDEDDSVDSDEDGSDGFDGSDGSDNSVEDGSDVSDNSDNGQQIDSNPTLSPQVVSTATSTPAADAPASNPSNSTSLPQAQVATIVVSAKRSRLFRHLRKFSSKQLHRRQSTNTNTNGQEEDATPLVLHIFNFTQASDSTAGGAASDANSSVKVIGSGFVDVSGVNLNGSTTTTPTTPAVAAAAAAPLAEPAAAPTASQEQYNSETGAASNEAQQNLGSFIPVGQIAPAGGSH